MGCVILTTLLGSVLSCLHCFRWPDTILGCTGSRVTGHCLWLLGVVRPKNHRFLSQEHRQEQGVRLGDLWKKVSAPAALCRGRCEQRLTGRTQHRPLRSANEGLCLQSRALGYQHMSPGGGGEWSGFPAAVLWVLVLDPASQSVPAVLLWEGGRQAGLRPSTNRAKAHSGRLRTAWTHALTLMTLYQGWRTVLWWRPT